MAWNDNGNDNDPWKRRRTEGGGPDDLDRIVQQWQRRLSNLFGGGGSGQQPGSGGGYFLVILAIVAWGLTGFYRVDEAERGIVQRFGEYVPEPTLPGLRWHLPFPIETVTKVNTIELTFYNYQTEMLTADEQYVFINLVVQYRRAIPRDYSFEVYDPESTLKDVTESALREVVGTSDLNSLVSGNREDIASRTQEALQATLNSYKAGITVTSISLEDVKYPQNVQNAVDDAQKARNDSDRYGLQADAYANDIIPRARGNAQKIREDAQAYKERVIADAVGEAARFEALLAEYQKAPRVTRDRLYLDAVEEVYRNSNKVILDSENSGNLMYLPIDKLFDNSTRSSSLPGNPRITEQALQDAEPSEAEASNPRARRTR